MSFDDIEVDQVNSTLADLLVNTVDANKTQETPRREDLPDDHHLIALE